MKEQEAFPLDLRFDEITADILAHPLFQGLKEHCHHGKENTLYDHSLSTAYCAYRLALRFHLPEDRVRAVTRAALLHDFFLYDWRSEAHRRFVQQYKGWHRIARMHAFTHGALAARRASRRFDLDDRQRAAITCHMFPLAPMPKSAEGWILTLADKMVASREVSASMMCKVRRLYPRHSVA